MKFAIKLFCPYKDIVIFIYLLSATTCFNGNDPGIERRNVADNMISIPFIIPEIMFSNNGLKPYDEAYIEVHDSQTRVPSLWTVTSEAVVPETRGPVLHTSIAVIPNEQIYLFQKISVPSFICIAVHSVTGRKFSANSIKTAFSSDCPYVTEENIDTMKTVVIDSFGEYKLISSRLGANYFFNFLESFKGQAGTF